MKLMPSYETKFHQKSKTKLNRFTSIYVIYIYIYICIYILLLFIHSYIYKTKDVLTSLKDIKNNYNLPFNITYHPIFSSFKDHIISTRFICTRSETPKGIS